MLARFTWIQLAKADTILVQPTLVMQADGVRRYQYNPRLLEVAKDLPKGTIFIAMAFPSLPVTGHKSKHIVRIIRRWGSRSTRLHRSLITVCIRWDDDVLSAWRCSQPVESRRDEYGVQEGASRSGCKATMMSRNWRNYAIPKPARLQRRSGVITAHSYH